ncbi:MAG: tripartite tricarboxylate transporter substrate-binding protein [Paralcaligenes sp.]
MPRLKAARHGDLRLLAISTPERDSYFPDVPTFREQGYNVVEALWRGVMVKTGTPPGVIAILSAAMDRVEANPAWKKFMRQNVQSPLNKAGEDMQNYVIKEVAQRRKFLQDIGVK